MPEMMMSMGMKKLTPLMVPVMEEKEKEKAAMKHPRDAHPPVTHVVPGVGGGVAGLCTHGGT